MPTPDDDFVGLMSTVEIIDDHGQENGTANPDLIPGTKIACPGCGKEYTVTAKGEIRSHNCVREIDGGNRAKPRGKGRGGRSRTAVPSNVYDFLVGAGEDCTEFVTSRYVARAIPCDLELAKDATAIGRIEGGGDALFGPIIKALWPELPKGAQKTLTSIADHADLIACAFAWAEYTAMINGFVRQGREIVAETAMEGGVQNGPTESGFDGQPFVPVVV